jgi:hypothetical protein
MTAATRGSRARFLEQRVVDPATLTPYPGNPNIGDVEAVRASLRANGQYRTPVTRRLPDGGLQVLAGHTTRLAAIAEHMPLRVDVVDADDKTARRIVLADNRTAQLSRYDEDLLLAILDGGDMEGTGWDQTAYEELLAGVRDGAGNGIGGAAGPAPTLADRFLIPPFDVLDARASWWQERKRAWLRTGMRSEAGRDAKLLSGSLGRQGNGGMADQVAGAERRRVGAYGAQAKTDEQGHLVYETTTGATSIFDPVLCELAYRWFSAEGHRILDPFAGGSVRGLVAAMLGRSYTGNDLSAVQVAANQEQADDFLARGLIAETPASVVPAGVVLDSTDATPVERHGTVWVKRDDLYQLPGGLAGCGGKVRSCLHLVTEAIAANPGVDRLVTAGSRHSPQVVIVAAVAAHLGLRCTAHVPASKDGSSELAAAVALGAELMEHRPGYNTVIVARAREDADADPAAVHVPFGMETPHAVTETRKQAVGLFKDWPAGARRLVVPVGSGMTLAGILAATDDFGPEIVGVQVGADPTERLDAYAPAGWRSRVKLVRSALDYEQRPSDTHIGDLPLDPVYEAKCLPFLGEDDVLWVIGRRPDPTLPPVALPAWSVGDSSEWVKGLTPESYDLLFTCPPYLGLERYSDDPADLSNLSTADFEARYGRILAGCTAALRPNRFAVIVVGDVRDKGGSLTDFRGMTVRCAEQAGLSLTSAAVLVTPIGSLAVRAAIPFQGSRKLGRTHQHALVFCKGDQKAAAEVLGSVEVAMPDALEPEDQ